MKACDLDPDCHDQGCAERPDSCRRVLDMRAGIDRRKALDSPPERVVVVGNPTGIFAWAFRGLFKDGA